MYLCLHPFQRFNIWTLTEVNDFPSFSFTYDLLFLIENPDVFIDIRVNKSEYPMEVGERVLC